MHSASDTVELLDVVCGRPTDSGSVHRYVHGGALFCFCSDACLATFIVDPSQFISINATAGKTGTAATSPGLSNDPPSAAPAGITASKRPKPALHRDASVAQQVMPTLAAASATVTVPEASTPRFAVMSRAPVVAPSAPVPSEALLPMRLGGSNVLASFFAWREKRFAARTCKELLKLHRIVSSRDPQLTGHALYRQIVAAHNGGDFAAADAVLTAAEQSFATWPAKRRLKFSDVVHFLAASEFLASQSRGRWIHADLRRIVVARIPHGF
jgi:YHS domain-containing protein